MTTKAAQTTTTPVLAVVTTGPPGPEAGRVVEVELDGESVSIGEWRERDDGLWELVLESRYALAASMQSALERVVRHRDCRCMRVGNVQCAVCQAETILQSIREAEG